MTADYVRRTYDVDVKVGQRITVDGRPGTVVSFPGQYLGVRFDGETRTSRAHPTWRVDYHPAATTETSRGAGKPRSKAQIAREQGLSLTIVDYLRELASREKLGRGPCWVFRQPRNRWCLLVPSERDRYQRAPEFSRNGRALAILERDGWIVYGPDGYLPAPFAREYGSTITLTDKARAALGVTRESA